MKQVIYKERKQTDCVKWDGCKEKFGMEELLPLWVADMDFEAPVCVKEALKNYVDFGVYGYYQPPKAYFEAFENWEENTMITRLKISGFDLHPAWCLHLTG